MDFKSTAPAFVFILSLVTVAVPLDGEIYQSVVADCSTGFISPSGV